MKMPVLFAGHGSPMNAIEDNIYGRGWEKLAEVIPTPKCILAVSAHWQTSGTRINNEARPRQIYDFYGFPRELYEVKYEAPGSPELAERVGALIGDGLIVDNSWGTDHGSWSVLSRIWPDADIPVVQLSLDTRLSPEEHFLLGQKLEPLREEGCLIFGSGNVVHNLSLVDWGVSRGFKWAEDFDKEIRDAILDRRLEKVVENGKPGTLPVPTNEHYLPLLYCLGAAGNMEKIEVFNEGSVLGAVSMTGYIIY